MAGYHVDELHQPYFAGCYGVLVNSNDGFYLREKSYGMETNLSTTREAWGVEASGNEG
jgi:hypothetical protein